MIRLRGRRSPFKSDSELDRKMSARGGTDSSVFHYSRGPGWQHGPRPSAVSYQPIFTLNPLTNWIFRIGSSAGWIFLLKDKAQMVATGSSKGSFYRLPEWLNHSLPNRTVYRDIMARGKEIILIFNLLSDSGAQNSRLHCRHDTRYLTRLWNNTHRGQTWQDMPSWHCLKPFSPRGYSSI